MFCTSLRADHQIVVLCPCIGDVQKKCIERGEVVALHTGGERRRGAADRNGGLFGFAVFYVVSEREMEDDDDDVLSMFL